MKPIEEIELLGCPLPERFANKFTKGEGCWIWHASTNGKGYGHLGYEGKHWLAHRLSYTLHKGSIPEGMTIDHLCNQPRCVNPKHLAIATHKANNARSGSATAVNGRKTHCNNGHEFTPENTRVFEREGGIRRHCKVCKKQWRQYAASRTPSISYGDAVEKVAMAMSELDDAQPLCKATYVQLAKTAVAAMGIEEGKE